VLAVQSSDLAGVDYDGRGTLTIAFHSRDIYEYYGVPESKYRGLMSARSHGKYFHAHIKGWYEYQKVRG